MSDLVRHRKSGSNTSLPEMINNSAKQYDSSSAVSTVVFLPYICSILCYVLIENYGSV